MIKTVSDLIGKDNLIKLIQAFHGKRLYIPVKPKVYHRISKIIGYDNCLKLSNYYGGKRWVIPTLKQNKLFLRNQQISKEFRDGATLEALSRKYDLTVSYLKNILKK